TFPEKTIYLKPLTHQQVESFALLNYLALTESVTDREILDFTTIPDDLKNLPDFWYTLSYIAQGHQDFEQALVYIKAAEKLDPEAPAIKYLLGAAHYKLSNFAQAEKHYDEFLQTDLSKVPEEHIESVARALINLADIKIGLNDLEGAREVAKRTRRLFPEKNKPLLQLGMAYSGLENFSMARYYLKRFIKTADNEKYNYYIAYFTLSSIELDGENFEGALPYLERAVEFAPEEAHCWYMLALTYRHIGRWENALSAAKIAFQLDPFTEGHVTFYMKIQEEQNSFFSSFTNDLIF
ncbi:tetratricopeptide repeat protein, partial [bacterium]|nr:tetratricopeptide repeat protein [bacterium]